MDLGLIVVWRVTEQCDLACRFCGYSRELRRPRWVADPEQVRAFGAVLADYSRAQGRPVLVSWLGGEPLLWRPLLEISREFHALGLGLGVTTNGTALGRAEVREALARYFDHVVVSVDGLGKMHDRLRGQPGLYDELRLNVAALREDTKRQSSSMKLHANTVLMRDNIADFEALAHVLAEWGIKELTFNILGGRDRPEFYPDHSLLPEQLARFRAGLQGLRARMQPLGLAIRGSARYLDRLDNAVRGAPVPVADCGPGTQFLFVDEGGYASPCSFTVSHYGVPLSHISSPADLARLPEQLAARRKLAPAAVCADCPSTQVFGKFAAA